MPPGVGYGNKKKQPGLNVSVNFLSDKKKKKKKKDDDEEEIDYAALARKRLAARRKG